MLRECSVRPIPLLLADPFLGRFDACPGLVNRRQTFVRRCQRGRRRAVKADKGRELPAGNYRPAAAGGVDAAPAAVSWATEDEG